MKLTLRQQLTQFAHVLQSSLFPVLEEEVGQLGECAKKLVTTLEMIPLARFVPSSKGWIGRPSKDRYAVACAFVAKAVYGFATTTQLLERLAQDAQLRRICGWTAAWQVPHESTFSRAFAEFSQMELPQFVHEALIRETQKDRLIGHIARDSTAIEARERFPETTVAVKAEKRSPGKRGPRTKGPRGPHKRWKGGQPRRALPEGTRLSRQRTMSLSAMLAELPKNCSIGVKTSSKGYQQYWRGYKLHLDVADGQVPISCVLTSASLNDTQVAVPLALLTAQRVTSLYDLMDMGYDSYQIRAHSITLGHVPIIPRQKRGTQPAPVMDPHQQVRFRERTVVERVYARLKEEFGGQCVRVRGCAKVMAHLMFGILALTADQILRWIGPVALESPTVST